MSGGEAEREERPDSDEAAATPPGGAGSIQEAVKEWELEQSAPIEGAASEDGPTEEPDNAASDRTPVKAIDGWDDLAGRVCELVHSLKDDQTQHPLSWDALVQETGIGRSSLTSAGKKSDPEFSLETLAWLLVYTRKVLADPDNEESGKLAIGVRYVRVLEALVTFLAGSNSKMREYAFAQYLGIDPGNQVDFSKYHAGAYILMRWDEGSTASLSSLHIKPRAADSVVCHFSTLSRNAIHGEPFEEVADGYVYLESKTIYAIARTGDGSLRYSILKEVPGGGGDMIGVRLLYGNEQPVAQRIYAAKLFSGDPEVHELEELSEFMERIDTKDERYERLRVYLPNVGRILKLLQQVDGRYSPHVALTVPKSQ